ncbi:MAG: hypothetical protein WBA68_03870, partial [Alteraurantiacibacter sp.]
RDTTPDAPAPHAPPDMRAYTAAQPATSAPVAAAPQPQPAPEAQSDILPQSGNVRSEYANSGRWIERP